MQNRLAGVAEFLADALCDLRPDGTAGKASFARISLAMLLAFVLGWVTALTIWHRELPDLSGVIGFVSAWGGLVYTPSKFVSAWQNRGVNGNGEHAEGGRR